MTDLPMIVALNARSEPLAASTDGQVYAVNQTPNRYRIFVRRVSFQADPKYVRARCGAMKESMIEPGGHAKIDDVLSAEWKDRAVSPRKGAKAAIALDVVFSRVGGAEPPVRHAFDLLSPSGTRHGRGFVVEPSKWLLPSIELPSICSFGAARSDDPASIDTHIYCANNSNVAFQIRSSGNTVTTYDGATDQLMAPANRSCEVEIDPGAVAKIGEVARWEWYHPVMIDIVYKLAGRAVIWQDYDLAQVSPLKQILPQVGIAKLILPRSWALPA
jgi:hypothetical protein